MTNPITEPTQSIRERLARAAFGKMIAPEDLETEGAYVVIDAILAEMEKPSEVMVQEGAKYVNALKGNGDHVPHSARARDAWTAMIQHIRSGGK